MHQKTWFSHKYLTISTYIDFLRFCFPFFCIRWLMGYDLPPANTAWYAHDICSDTVGFQSVAKMGKQLGEVAHTLSDSAFLWSYALLRGIISLCNSLIISVAISQNTFT